MTNKELGHRPVLIEEVIEQLGPKDNETYIDATFGNGGYTERILQSCECKVIAIDRDPTVKKQAERFKKKFGSRFSFVHSKFSQIDKIFKETKEKEINGFVFDIGVSSMQLDDANRGFSFMQDGPLDMRMSQDGQTASDLINKKDKDELADIIYHYGDERNSRKIARNIEKNRTQKKIESTIELAEIIKKSFPSKYYKKHPATKTFQAIRIFINNEIQELHAGLNQAFNLLRANGKICVVTFHSIEDRLVKNFTNKVCLRNKKTKLIKPSSKEILSNPRSRSAKLRVIKREQSNFNYIPISELGFEL